MQLTPVHVIKMVFVRAHAHLHCTYTYKNTYVHTCTYNHIHVSGADPGFRRGGFVHSEQEFVRTGILGADPNCCRVLGKSTSKKKLQTAVGGVSDHPKNPPVSAHVYVHTHIRTHIHVQTDKRTDRQTHVIWRTY